MLALLMYLHSRRQSYCSEPCRKLLFYSIVLHNDICYMRLIYEQALTLQSAGLRWQYLLCR